MQLRRDSRDTLRRRIGQHSRGIQTNSRSDRADDRRNKRRILRQPRDHIIECRDACRQRRQQVRRHVADKLRPVLTEQSRLVRPAVGRSGKVALCVRGNTHQIVIAQHSLLRLRHFIVRGRNTLRQRIGLQIGNRHIDAELFERFRFARNTGANLLERRVGVEVVERCHIAG